MLTTFFMNLLCCVVSYINIFFIRYCFSECDALIYDYCAEKDGKYLFWIK